MGSYHEDQDKIQTLLERGLTTEQMARLLVSVVNTAERRQTKNFLHFRQIDEPVNDLVRNHISTFDPVPNFNVITDRSRPHLLIEGDNLTALSGLSYTHEEKVDVIYIDPPYNTGNQDFRYNDKFVDEEDGWSSSKWLSMMEPRLRYARDLLRQTGVIIVAVGDDEDARCKLLLDSVFGEMNYISRVTWVGDIKSRSDFVSNSSDCMYIYARNRHHLVEKGVSFRVDKTGFEEMISAASEIWARTGNASDATREFKKWFQSQDKDGPVKGQKGNLLYNNIDEQGRIYRLSDLGDPGGKGNNFDVPHPATGKPCTVPARGWMYSEDKMKQYGEDGLIIFGKDETTVPALKRLLEDTPTIVLRDSFFMSRSGASQELTRIIGRGKFDFPKDHTVLMKWIDYVIPQSRKDDVNDPPVVMDFFAGSGSTGHAVLELNAQDGIARRFILVTNNENKICQEVTLPRLRNVMTGKWADGKQHKPLGGNLMYFRAGHWMSDEHWMPTSTQIATHRKYELDEFVHLYEQEHPGVFALKYGTPILHTHNEEAGYSVWVSDLNNNAETSVLVVHGDINRISQEAFYDEVQPALDKEFPNSIKVVTVPDGWSESAGKWAPLIILDDADGWQVERTSNALFGVWWRNRRYLDSMHHYDFEAMLS